MTNVNVKIIEENVVCEQHLVNKLHDAVTLALQRLNEDKERAPCIREKDDMMVRMWSQRNIALDVLMACWGLGTWLGVNGLYVQLPLLVDRLPERWELPTSMVLAVQLANVGLLVYAGLRRFVLRASDASYIYGLLTIGMLALLLNAFVYPYTMVINGTETSFAFLMLTFFAALVGCTSSVLFYPHLRHFRDIYLVTFLVGEGLSGFIPSIIALIQGVGGEPKCVPSNNGTDLMPIFPPPRFSSTVFLIILSALSAMSLVSFIALENLSIFKSEKVTPSAVAKNEEATAEPVELLSVRWISVLLVTAYLNALMNAVLPSVQPYSCNPYGADAYHLAVTLGAMANPAACLAGVWLRPVSARALAAALAASLLPLAYIFATALLSPAPPLQHHVAGVILVVACWVCVSGVVSYARMWVYAWARRGGARGMRACGAGTQLGSALGSLLIYVLVKQVQLFAESPVCAAPSPP